MTDKYTIFPVSCFIFLRFSVRRTAQDLIQAFHKNMPSFQLIQGSGLRIEITALSCLSVFIDNGSIQIADDNFVRHVIEIEFQPLSFIFQTFHFSNIHDRDIPAVIFRIVFCGVVNPEDFPFFIMHPVFEVQIFPKSDMFLDRYQNRGHIIHHQIGKTVAE